MWRAPHRDCLRQFDAEMHAINTLHQAQHGNMRQATVVYTNDIRDFALSRLCPAEYIKELAHPYHYVIMLTDLAYNPQASQQSNVLIVTAALIKMWHVLNLQGWYNTKVCVSSAGIVTTYEGLKRGTLGQEVEHAAAVSFFKALAQAQNNPERCPAQVIENSPVVTQGALQRIKDNILVDVQP